MDWLTLLISTSFAPSNPSIATITSVVTQMREQIPNVPAIIMFDGIYEALRYPDQQMFEQGIGESEELFQERTAKYEEFKRTLIPWCRENNVITVEFVEHTHRVNMTRSALRLVNAPCVMVIDHDTFMIDVNWDDVRRAMTNPQVNSIRFYHFEQIHPDHSHLFGDVEMIEGVPLRRTIQYGDHPNIHRTDFLRDLINKYFTLNDRCFAEGKLWQLCHNAGWEGQESTFKLWMYSPENMKCFMDLNIRNNIPTPNPVMER